MFLSACYTVYCHLMNAIAYVIIMIIGSVIKPDEYVCWIPMMISPSWDFGKNVYATPEWRWIQW